MARQNYMTIPVSDTVQGMFDDFVKEKDITKTAALSDMIEMYMLAKDEKLYLRLKKKYLGIEAARNMIEDRDASMVGAKDFIFLKLVESLAAGETLDGEQTMQLYRADEKKRGFTWFSTQSLFFGMNDARVKQYSEKIKKGETVTILFAVNNEHYKNEIAFRARVEEIRSSRTAMPCPDGQNYPQEFWGEQARIWLRLSHIEEETQIRAEMLKITSTGRNLKQAISDSQYHFGYVSLKD